MAYKAKFLHFKTKQSYNTERNKTSEESDERKVFDAYISFIDEGPTICTWGKEYKCSIDEARINEILEEKGVGEKEVEIISVPSEAIQGPTYEFTSSELYSQLDDAITNNRIIVASSTGILDGTNNSVMIVFSQAMKLGTSILLSGVMAPSISSNYVNLSTIVLGIESTGSCTIVTQNINPESTTPRPNSGYGSAGTSLNYSRGDHVHPAQTSVTGNAGTATKLQTARNINLTGNVTGSASFDGSDNISINTTVGNIDASKITSGTINASRLPEIPLEKLPAGALERLVIVENQAARYQLTTSDIQEGDTVKQNDTGVMYFVVDTDNLANENGYKVYTAGAATKVSNKLTFTGAVTGEYDGSSALTVNIPEGGSGGEVPIALPNPYPIKFTGVTTASYDGSSSVTVNIPKSTMTYSSYTYSVSYIGTNTSTGIYPNYVYYPSSWTSTATTALNIYVKANAFNANTPNSAVIVKGTRQVNLSFTSTNGWLVKQSNILTTGSASNTYRVYAFSYLGGYGSSTRVAVNCSEYTE